MLQNATHTNTIKEKIMTLDEIATSLNAGNWEPLYTATEEQIMQLTAEGKIDEDFYSRHQDYQEEMRCMMAEFS